jgi:hypothetical protein
VIDIANWGHGYETTYSALAVSTGDVITFTLTTPSGTESVPGHYDVAAGLAGNTLDDQPVVLTDGYELAPATGVTENITSVTGVPPVDIAVEGIKMSRAPLVPPPGIPRRSAPFTTSSTFSAMARSTTSTP